MNRVMGRLLVMAAVASGVVAGSALPAAAHVTVSPLVAPAGQLQLYTVQVPNELIDQATVEVDLTLPAGFLLDAAQSIPGWKTVITAKAGKPVEVAWKGGNIPVGTFVSFQLQGRNPRNAAVLTWAVVQRYEHETVRWDGPPTAEQAAPTVHLTAAAAADAPRADGLPGNPRGAQPTDDLARSRAALGIALSIAALGVGLGPVAVARLRRSALLPAVTAPEAPTRDPRQPAGPRRRG